LSAYKIDLSERVASFEPLVHRQSRTCEHRLQPLRGHGLLPRSRFEERTGQGELDAGGRAERRISGIAKTVDRGPRIAGLASREQRPDEQRRDRHFVIPRLLGAEVLEGLPRQALRGCKLSFLERDLREEASGEGDGVALAELDPHRKPFLQPPPRVGEMALQPEHTAEGREAARDVALVAGVARHRQGLLVASASSPCMRTTPAMLKTAVATPRLSPISRRIASDSCPSSSATS
jgi:hypothetical protein